MGGNVTAIAFNGLKTRAEKIPVKEIGIENFRVIFKQLFHNINNLFFQKHKSYIWKDSNIIDSGYVFNGSTSFLMNPKFNSEILDFKPNCGDIDITVPENIKEQLWEFLKGIENSLALTNKTNFIYRGSNKPTVQSIGEQINSVFDLSYNGNIYHCQVDFEFLPYENNKPTDWAKFSHGSSLVDAKENIKAVHHKYLIRALVGSTSYLENAVICTKKSTLENIKISKSKTHERPRLFKFSVGRGLRVAYEPVLDNGEQVFENGKRVFREIDSKESSYITNIPEILKQTFGKDEVSSMEIEKFDSFIGCLSMMKELPKETQLDVHDRYVELLWGNGRCRAQELEFQNPDLDLSIKKIGYERFVSELGLENKTDSIIKEYYENFEK